MGVERYVDLIPEFVLIVKVRKEEKKVYDILAMKEDSIPLEKDNEVQELGVALVVDVSASSNVNQQVTATPSKISPEVLPRQTILRIDTANCCVTIKSTSSCSI